MVCEQQCCHSFIAKSGFHIIPCSRFCLHVRFYFVWVIWDVMGSQILIPQSICLYLGLYSVITAHATVQCLMIWLDYVSIQVLQKSGHFYFTADCLIQAWFVRPFSTYQLYHSDSTAVLHRSIRGILSDHTVYCKGFCFRCHCTCRT